jgi:hypothetical protein
MMSSWKKVHTKKPRGRLPGPASTTPQLFGDDRYFFFEPLLLLLDDFLEEDEDLEAPFFDAAINAHHLSCRTGPPGRASWQHTPAIAG